MANNLFDRLSFKPFLAQERIGLFRKVQVLGYNFQRYLNPESYHFHYNPVHFSDRECQN